MQENRYHFTVKMEDYPTIMTLISTEALCIPKHDD